MVEKAKKILDKGGTFGALLTDLWKVLLYDTWPSYSETTCSELWFECIQLDV